MAPLKVVGMGTLRQERLCGAELVMVVTTSPLTNEPWRELLVLRCPDHIDTVSGILEFLPETWADEGPHGL